MLTEEDRKRIETNRLRAVQLRASKMKNGITKNEAVPSKIIKLDQPSSSKELCDSSSLSSKHISKTNATKFQSLNVLKGKCVLISRDRFEIDCGYSANLIKIIKSIESSSYDAIKKRWNLNFHVYDKFMKQLRVLSNEVQIEPLPNTVLNAFRTQLTSIKSTPIFDSGIDLRTVDETLLTTLFPFQLEALNFAISKGGRVLIADDMGLGKTVEALAVVSYFKPEWPVVIVAPAGVRHTWVEAINKFFSLDYLPRDLVYSPDSKKQLRSQVESLQSRNFIMVISYDLLKSLSEEIGRLRVHVVVLDESHLIKDYKSERCKAALELTKSAKRVILLSGTPALSRPVELFTQLQCINPSLFRNFAEYAYRYCDAKRRPEKLGGGIDASGASNLEELEILLKETVMIRRLKENVLKQLKPKKRHVVVLEKSLIQLEEKHLKKAKQTFQAENTVNRGALLLFFHETAKAKLLAVQDHLLSLVRSGKKMVVFAHHQFMIDAIHNRLSLEGFRVVRIDGSTSSVMRQEVCTKFQTKDDVKVALLSITAASTGLTLTAANLVVFAELFWNPGILLQAEDRVHRVGQEDDVEIQYLVAKGTADDDIWKLVKRKLEILGRGGLSKDDFNCIGKVSVKDDISDATVSTKKTTSIEKYFSKEEPDLDFDVDFKDEELICSDIWT